MELQLHGVRLPLLRADMIQQVEEIDLYGTDEADEYRKMMKARKNVGTRLT